MHTFANRLSVFTVGLSCILASAFPVQAQLQAGFIDGTYVFTPDGCDKLKALAAGGTPTVMAQPWTVSAEGISFWEGGCNYSAIEKSGPEQWLVTTACSEHEDNYVESYVFKRMSKTTFAVTLTTPGTAPEDRLPKTYTRCDIPPVPATVE